MMNPLVMGGNVPARSPPEKGSFPLDHFQECKVFHDDYLRCLRSTKNDNLACKEVSKNYLQCRMDKNLMTSENLETLGYSKENMEMTDSRKQEIAVREEQKFTGKLSQDDGFLVIKESLKNEKEWRRPSILGGGTWKIKNPFSNS
jgi:cytochrome c oxidase assembly protein subunit 19